MRFVHASRSATPIRGQRLRRGGHDPRGAALDAQTTCRTYHQHHVDGRDHDAAGPELLSRHALEGISESLGKEIKNLGIKVTAVEPGGFRTDWAGRSMVRAARSIDDYDSIMEPIRKRRMELSGWQVGDPQNAAQAMLKLGLSDNPPAHLLLGSDAVRLVEEKMKSLQAEFEAWKSVSPSTDVG
jgi:hypothetical protein